MQLRPLERQGLIEQWHDREISAGAEWEREIDKHLNTAQIILLMISPDFMNSEYCYNVEVKQAIERHKRGRTVAFTQGQRYISLSHLQKEPKTTSELVQDIHLSKRT